MFTATWSLISSSAEVITGARRMTVRIHRLLQPGLIELSESDRRRLFSLQKRVECLVQPLNYLLLWSKKRDSCVHQVVLSAQELLVDVCTFVERFTPQDGASPTVGKPPGAPGGGTIDSDQLEYYLRELEFACASVNMAVSIAKSTDSQAPQSMQMPMRANDISAGAANRGLGARSGGVSLSALLRASRRIQEMSGRSGDLCACPGRLYAQTPSSSSRSGVGCVDDASSSGGAESSFAGLNADVAEPAWQPVLSLATFKVVAAIQGRLGRRYSIQVESRLPLSQRNSPRMPAPPVDPVVSPIDGFYDVDAASRGLNAQGPLAFSMEVALDACLRTTAHVSLPTEPTRICADLGIDSLVLLWGGGPRFGGSSASNGNANGRGSFDEAVMSSEFPDAVLLPESAGQSQWGGRQARYAFVFEGPRGIAEVRSGEAEVALTPLDAMYLARLCALDDGQQQPFQQDGAVDAVNPSCPPHLLTSDEVLEALLQDMEGSIDDDAAQRCADQRGRSIAHERGEHGGTVEMVMTADADNLT